MLPTVHRSKTQTNSPKAAGPAFTGITAFDTDTFNIRRPNSASTRVVLLTELLEEILLYLPINDLMALRGASPLFHHCISHSPRLQTKLFLRPSKAPLTFYNWSWSRLDSNGLPVGDLHLQETKLLPRANTKTPYWESLCEPSPVQPARTCPLIHSWGIPKDQWPTELTDTDLPVTCVGIIATPEELARFGTMLFTDPPVYEMHAKLHYRHNRDANLYITGERHVKSEFPLTVHGFLDAAFRMPGDTCVHDVGFRDVETGGVSQRHMANSSFEEAVADRIQLHTGYFNLVFNKTPIYLKGLQVLEDEQWDFMVDRRAEQQQHALAEKKD
jgi:hypothetical protein